MFIEKVHFELHTEMYYPFKGQRENDAEPQSGIYHTPPITIRQCLSDALGMVRNCSPMHPHTYGDAFPEHREPSPNIHGHRFAGPFPEP